jgi:PspA-Associated protein
VIVRISGEGQYRLDDAHVQRLNELDNEVVAAVDGDDEDGFHASFEELLAFVRGNGAHLADDELSASDHIFPPADISFPEAGEEFTGDGLIPEPS